MRAKNKNIYAWPGFFLRFPFGDRKEILRDRLEEFERPFSIDVISGHYILRDRWRNLRDRFGPSKHLKKTLCESISEAYVTYVQARLTIKGSLQSWAANNQMYAIRLESAFAYHCSVGNWWATYKLDEETSEMKWKT